MSFKVGDTVEVVRILIYNTSYSDYLGKFGTILKVRKTSKYPYRVTFDTLNADDFMEGELALIRPAYKVYEKEGGHSE